MHSKKHISIATLISHFVPVAIPSRPHKPSIGTNSRWLASYNFCVSAFAAECHKHGPVPLVQNATSVPFRSDIRTSVPSRPHRKPTCQLFTAGDKVAPTSGTWCSSDWLQGGDDINSTSRGEKDGVSDNADVGGRCQGG